MLSAGGELRIGPGVGNDVNRPAHVNLDGNAIAGQNIRVESAGDVNLTHVRQRAAGFVKVMAAGNLVATDATLIGQTGPVVLKADSDQDGHGTLTTSNVRISQITGQGTPLDLGHVAP